MAATYNVPALVQVKAPQIKVQKDAYTNPQPLYNKAYEEYAKFERSLVGKEKAIGKFVSRFSDVKQPKGIVK